eukprot:TRINITY_DN8956_c0_g1_i1.p1 TRINITY_DN8956_c0_g1~~TRINITY_DN8956_c0_g1_i1.p1  ORF type:complete len:274 (-),score=58.49 TRINITY_DN8956_c0_g1_i1:589-1410(-)
MDGNLLARKRKATPTLPGAADGAMNTAPAVPLRPSASPVPPPMARVGSTSPVPPPMGQGVPMMGMGDILRDRGAAARRASPPPASAAQALQQAIGAGGAGTAAATLREGSGEQRPSSSKRASLEVETARGVLRAPAKTPGIVPIAQLSEEQRKRVMAWRRTKFDREVISNMVVNAAHEAGAKGVTALGNTTSIAVSALAKMFVGDLVETARTVMEERGENTPGAPIQPKHYLEAYARLAAEGTTQVPETESDHSAISSTTPSVIWRNKVEDFI